MSTTPDFCCDTKCITIKKCDGPWCLGSVREDDISATDCTRATTGNCCLGQEGALHGLQLRVGSNAACCGTLRRCDTLEIVNAAGTVTQTLSIRAIRNGVIIARDGDGAGYRLEGYKGHLVHVRVFSTVAEANDGLRQDEDASYHTYSKCANKDCSQTVPACSSTDAPCGCPC